MSSNRSSHEDHGHEDHGLFSDKLKAPEIAAPKAQAITGANESRKQTQVPEDSPARDRVYVIDDSPTILTVVSGILKTVGFAPLAFRDPKAALEEIKKLKSEDLKTVKAVFSDLDMPELTGLDLLRELRAHEPTASLPFVMITGKKEREHIQQAALLKVNGYLLKPVSTQILLDLVGTLFPDYAGASHRQIVAKAR